MRGIANTRQRKEINLKAAVKAEKRVEGPKAERSATSTKAMRGEAAQGAKTKTLTRKRESQNLITAKIEIRATNLTKSIKRTQKEVMVTEQGQHQKARREQLIKMGTDQVADTGIEAKLQYRKTKKKNEEKTDRGAGSVAGVRRDVVTVTGIIRDEEHPGIRNVEQEVQTETRLETHTEAGAPEVRVIREATARIDHLIEKTKIGQLPTKDVVATVLKVTETRKGNARRAQIPKDVQRVPPGLKSEAQPDQDQIVRKAKTGMTARE